MRTDFIQLDRKIDFRQFGAFLKCFVADHGHRIRQNHLFHRFIEVKCHSRNRRNTVGNSDGSLTGTSVHQNRIDGYELFCRTLFAQPDRPLKCAGTDLRHSFRNLNRRQLFAARKCVLADCSHAVRNRDRGERFVSEKHRISDCGDRKPVDFFGDDKLCSRFFILGDGDALSVRIDRIVKIGRVGGFRCRYCIEGFIRDVVLLCVGFRIGACIALDCHLIAMPKRITSDCIQIHRQCDFRQSTAGCKRTLPDFFHAVRQGYFSQFVASPEGIFIHFGQSRRKIDRRQGITAVKRMPADTCQTVR